MYMQLSKNETADKIYKVVQSIPKGSVMSYKEVALAAGIKNPRHIGRYLHENPDPKTIPCHRVIHSDGTVANGYAFGGPHKQIELLRQEGVPFKNGRAVLGTSN